MARLLHESDTSGVAGNLERLLPDGVHVWVASTCRDDAPLHPLEEEFLRARRMQPVREHEFRVGRALAREALARFGVTDYALLPAPTREPQWPLGIVGSISHCRGMCAVAVGESARFSGLGIDLERIDRIEQRIADTICTAQDRRDLESLPPSARRERLALLFSAKESVFKAQFPSTRQFLDFHDVSLTIGEGSFTASAATPAAHRVESLIGRFLFGSELVATAAWLPAT